jgi:phospholipid-translocating P-type ATPase (flippase)
VNKSIMLIFMIQLCMAVLSAILSGIWASSSCGSHSYLACSTSGLGTTSLTFWTYIILLNSLIPASLIVTMEIVKVVHASFINWDHTLCKRYDKKEEKWRGAEAHTSSLNEGLGQIDYIFSDKTGTLTENKMELQYVTIDGTIYGAATGVSYSDKVKADGKLDLAPVGSGGEEQKEALVEDSSAWKFNRMLAVCQTVLIEKEDDGSLSYNADSPDEVALVLGGKTFGAEFLGRENGDVSLVNVWPSGKPGSGPKVDEQWRVLSIIPFSSKRKRMTVIVQRVNPPNENPGEVLLWMKGADNVIMDRVDKSDTALIGKYNRHLVHFSTLGLRTLCFATKKMAVSEHAKWQTQWDDAALLPPDQREAKFEELASLVEDVGFALCGATAVEDKLQDNVPETIVRLARANVKLWVLTGDKQETAIEIGRSTNLLTPSTRMHVLNADSEAEVTQKLDKELADAMSGKEQNQKQGLVVDGATLNYVLEGDPQGALICKPAADKFVALATQCVAVVVCRSSPLQKALIVLLVKKYVTGVRTLAVGDGANDVPMIRAAAIGIGIAGLEGMQAARAADYAIQQFQDLDRLMLHHGRLSYFRIANMCCYFFYKSWAFTLPQWLFGFYCGYSGISFYEALYVPSFNMFFTSMPVFARAVLDTDVDLAKAYPLLPEMYHVSQDDLLFNQKTLGTDLFLSFLHAALCFWLPLLCFSGDDQDLWQTSLGCYSLVVFVCTVRILVHTRAITVPTLFAYGASIGVYFAWQYFYDAAGAITIRGAAPTLNADNVKFKFLVLLVFGLTASSELAMRFFADNLKPSNVDIVRAAKPEEIETEGKRRSDEASAAQVS